MEEAQKFGARLRELRIQAGLTQRELAKRVNVDFTYLSKIENGVLPPPSEKVILQLDEVLDADKDELITLAGRIPSDIAQMLRNQETLQFLRSDRVLRKARLCRDQFRARQQSADLVLPAAAASEHLLQCTDAPGNFHAVPTKPAKIGQAAEQCSSQNAARAEPGAFRDRGEH